MRKLFTLMGLLVVASMVLAACGGGATPTTAPAQPEEPAATEPPAATQPPATEPPAAEPGILRVNSVTFPDIVDPQKSSFVSEIAVLQMVYEGVTKLDGDLNTVPAASDKWEYNADATQLSFHLRDGLTYSDGSPLNAARFEYSFHRNIDPATAGEYAAITDDILGAAEWRGCTDSCDDEKAVVDDSVKASHEDGSDCTGYDDAACNTFTLKFKQPAPYFHTVASLWVGYPAKQELIEAGGENWWLDPANQIGNGPFVLSNLEQGVNAHFVPNENYWDTKPSYELDYSYIVDSAVAFEAFKNDELDIVVAAAEDLGTIQNDATLKEQYVNYAGSCTFAVMFHQLKEPFTDPAVRAAFSYALDRNAWVTDVLQGLGAPALTWIPPGFPGFKEGETRFGFDAAKAVQTLTDAGYTVENGQLMKGGTAIPIELTFSDSPRNRTRYEWLAAKYKEVLGIDMPLNPVEATTYTSLTKDVKTAPQMFILGWCADYPDPQNWLSVYWKTGAFGERIGFSNPDMDALMSQADAELDPTKRADLYQQAQDMLVAGGYVAFMWNNVNSYLVKPWVKDITRTPMDANWPGQQVPTSITVEAH
ncbi:MAG TPA: ABC transporter substrate-binding protein [Anaerolineales bacterium]|nr:ABC transporter substrate-binding protein [Anaerolineales bacterium]